MGGNALSVPTIRLSATQYGELAEAISIRFPARAAVIPSYRDKADFGDMDVLVAGGPGYDPATWAAALAGDDLAPKEFVRNGDVTSFGLKQPGGVFQVDLIKVPPESFDFAYRYFAMNDLGNLLGRVAHKAGFKLGHLGLLYTLREGQHGEHVIAELPVTRDWGEALSMLGYDAAAYERGLAGEFRYLEDIFQYVITSPFFHPDIYQLENRNNVSRTRDRKRPTYNAFLKWLDDDGRVTPSFSWSAKTEIRAQFLQEAKRLFPAFDAALIAARQRHERDQSVRQKVNGRFIQELTGLEGKALGQLIANLKSAHSTPADYADWVLSASDAQIRLAVLELANSIEQAPRPRPKA
ncbi:MULTISPECIES: hypothetical protein [Achromobacter]|uniref:hypothetical protein n=1 Tax=Achromobacter TaxID=222 RepID=UPI0023F82249|nr:hypothetical protein [Achromobacter anxifer]MDF8365101.1 hypothetical protein [Achromobacter anxifer]